MADDQTGNDPWAVPIASDDEFSDRPTIGVRMAGRVPPPAAAPLEAPPAPPIQFDPNKIPESIRPRAQDPSTVPVPPSGSNNPNLVDLAKKQAQYGTPLNAADPKYKMGVGTRILASAGNFLSRFGNRNAPVMAVGPGATNARYARDESMREGNLQNVNTQIGTQEKLDDQNRKLYEDAIKQAYEGKLAEAQGARAAADTSKAETASQLADIKELAVKNQFEEASKKLEQRAKEVDDKQRMGMDQLDLKRQLGEMAIQMKQQQLENDKAKFSTGVDAKSLEAERKQRLTAIEDDWKQHPYMNKLFGDKNKEIQAVNDDINTRLQQAGVGPASPKGAAPNTPQPVQKGYTRIKASDGTLHDIPSNKLKAAKARDPKLQVIQ